MQIDPFVGAIVVNPGDTAAGNLQFYFFHPAAVKQAVRQQQQETGAAARFTGFGSSAEIVDTEAHGLQVRIAEAVIDPLAVAPAYDDNVSKNTEKYQGNDDPLLVLNDIKHFQTFRWYPNVAKAGGLQSPGVKGEVVVGYRKSLTTQDLESSGFPEG